MQDISAVLCPEEKYQTVRYSTSIPQLQSFAFSLIMALMFLIVSACDNEIDTLDCFLASSTYSNFH